MNFNWCAWIKICPAECACQELKCDTIHEKVPSLSSQFPQKPARKEVEVNFCKKNYFPIVMTHIYNFLIVCSIYMKSRKVRRVQSVSHQKFSDDRGGELYFFTAHGHYFCLSVCLLIILNTVALIFSIVISHGTAHNQDSL